MATVQKSVEQQKAESDRIEKLMTEASIKATKARAAQGKLTPRQISNVKTHKRYASSRSEILESQRKATTRYVTVEGSYKTQEEAAKASSEISKQKDIHSTRVVKHGDQYVVKGQYTGDLKNVKVTRDWRQQAARELETKGSTVIAGRKFTKEELAPGAEKVVLKPGEKEITPDVAYDAGLISKRDYERSKTLEGSYVIVQEGSVKAAKDLKKKWTGKFTTDPAPGQREIDRIIWAEKEIPYMAEDEATRKTIKAVSKDMTAAEIAELKEPTFGQKLIQRTRDVRKVQGENVFQWMGESVVEYGGGVLHGGEMLLRPSGRKAISNVVFDMPAPEDRGNIFEVSQGKKQGSLLQQAAVTSGKELVEHISSHPVEFGVKAVTVAALTYGVSKGVGYVKAAKTPISHSVGKGQVFVSSQGKTAVGRSSVATIVGKGGKQGTYLTKVQSAFKKTGDRIIAGQKQTTTKGTHIFKTQSQKGGKVTTARGLTTDVSLRTGPYTDLSKQFGAIVKKGKLGKTKVSYTFGKQKHLTMAEVGYDKPAIVQVGKGQFAQVTGKADVLSYGKAAHFKTTRSLTKPTVINKLKFKKSQISAMDYATKLQKTGELNLKFTARYPTKNALATYNVQKNLITMPPKGKLPRFGFKYRPSEKQVLTHELKHFQQSQRIKDFNKQLIKEQKQGVLTREMAKKKMAAFDKMIESEALKFEGRGKFYTTKIVQRPTVKLTKPGIKVTGKGHILSKTDIYQLAGRPDGSHGGAGPFYKTQLSPTTTATTELAKKAGETVALTTLRKQMSPTPIAVPYSRVKSAPTVMDLQINSPAKLIMGPHKTRDRPIPGPELFEPVERTRVTTSTGILDAVIQKTRPDMGKPVINTWDVKTGSSIDRVFPAVITPQATTSRITQHQTEVLLFGTVTGVKQRVGHPTPVFQNMIPGSFRPATIFPMTGMALEAPRKKKKKLPPDWWSGVHIHPVKNPIELFGIPVIKRGRRKK